MNLKQNCNTRLRIPFKFKVLSVVTLIAGIFAPGAAGQSTGSTLPFGEGIVAKKFYASVVDNDNKVWFLTEAGVVSFDGTKWTSHNKNPKIASTGLKGVAYDLSSNRQELLIATSAGATVATLPIDAKSDASSLNPENSKILSNNVLALAVGKKELRWFATDKGISALLNGKWLANNYEDRYPESIFEGYPITSLATSTNGDSLYIGSKGGGVMRVYRDDVDAVSGASEFAEWGPILMPSDSVYCIHITPDGTQWIGTDKGAARHKGYKTLEGWTVFTTVDGLAGDMIQAINSDKKGNLYFGTKNGLSVFDGTNWTKFQVADGLVSNNILSIAIDRNNVVWMGTDNGVTCIKEGKFTSYH
jgi:ligand-binding sensor domain-containing protein